MTEQSHITLSELQNRIATIIATGLPLPLWVCAEIAELKVNYSGHCYLELVEKEDKEGKGAPKAQARGVIWRSAYLAIARQFEKESGSPLAAGMKILCRATVNYHPLYGLSLQISDINPSYTLGDIERQRQLTIERLKSDGVWDMNRQIRLPEVVERVAILSSSSAAGYRDFMRELSRSPFRFTTELFEAVMQGPTSEDSIVEALGRIAEVAERFDAVVIVRGGGSTSDLNWFNSYRIASYVAQMPIPVLTGIGHDKDVSVTDLVAHTMLKTPTAVATWLHDRSAEAYSLVEEAALRLSDYCYRLTSNEGMRLQGFAERIHSLALVRLSTAQTNVETLEERIRQATLTRVQRERERLDMLATQSENFAPERLLQLGFAVARSEGKTVRSIDDVKVGDTLEISLADGIAGAKVEYCKQK